MGGMKPLDPCLEELKATDGSYTICLQDRSYAMMSEIRDPTDVGGTRKYPITPTLTPPSRVLGRTTSPGPSFVRRGDPIWRRFFPLPRGSLRRAQASVRGGFICQKAHLSAPEPSRGGNSSPPIAGRDEWEPIFILGSGRFCWAMTVLPWKTPDVSILLCGGESFVST